VLQPWLAWGNEAAWTTAARGLAAKFRENFMTYAEQAVPDVLAAGPG
jgi:ATP-dependent phosphoenolpyruvate carboxykinase